LVNVFNEQLKTLQLTDKQSQNINLLSQESTFTITTGHQLNLFSGPVFLFIKFSNHQNGRIFLSKFREKLRSRILDGNRRPRF
jgi:uncharacterized protein YllA (UPF0747 family)